jgi:DNA polymerase III delta prime subunit
MIVGHKKIVSDLEKLADTGVLSHGYLFYGPAMVGKKKVAWELAGYLENGNAKNEGDKILFDATVIEAGEHNSVGIDAVREARNFLWQKPNRSARRTFIIDDAELLTTEAQNALLKITEEPPSSSLLILISSDPESLLPTILSRLEKIYFGIVPEPDVVAWLKEEEKMSQVKAVALAKRVFGKPGLAWRLTHDGTLEKNITLAEKFLVSTPTTRRDLIKKIIDPDDFNFRNFLDAVILALAARGVTKKNAALWHKALTLYARETDFSLNPRLQLEALLAE